MTNGVVHKTHCCLIHGCKYGDDNCPVVMGRIIQKYPCDKCNLTDYSLKRIKEAEEGQEDMDANKRFMFKEIVNQEKELKVLRMIAQGAKNVIYQYNSYAIMVSCDIGELSTLINEWEGE